MAGLEAFCDWLSETPPSQLIQNVEWIVPATQTVHILAVATAFAAMAMFDLAVIGVAFRASSRAVLVRRYVPWMWGALAVLLTTGVILTTGEPRRELLNWAFRLKMLLVITAATLTGVLSTRAAQDKATTLPSRIIAALALTCWVAIIVCGRWIAYTNADE